MSETAAGQLTSAKSRYIGVKTAYERPLGQPEYSVISAGGGAPACVSFTQVGGITYLTVARYNLTAAELAAQGKSQEYLVSRQATADDVCMYPTAYVAAGSPTIS